ncbi:AAA family ATPase [Streptomyces sp. NPDC089173]|uniref:AAA family ATPase n=1 Tax=Streptomyces sp. NPDC089173 TaxID=3154965 RepID=UPI00344C1599
MGVLPMPLHLPSVSGVRAVIIYLHGSRGSGKSALARGLAEKLDAQLLRKEELHKVLFPGEGHSLSQEKDGWLGEVLLKATAWSLETEPTRTVVLDSQRAGRAAEVPGLLRFSRALHQELHVVECIYPGWESGQRTRDRPCRTTEGHFDAVLGGRTHLVDMSAPPSAALQNALSCLRASSRGATARGDESRSTDGVPAVMSDGH